MKPKSCLIKDTTREQRQKIVNDAIALSTLDALPPSDDVMNMFKLYIDGKIELKDIKTVLINSYSKAYAV